ncbi:uncharacterized protein LOC111291162 [Durio zibethinus]|uniref:Uncharacterized protein LOC111291162 n=1 Tax=Durio zibethinus TaxID=66656 RepID=A0A6P5YDV7_DURZI|nr:uncharacterized protein LOC111291162 [Durio zibethinus]
MEDARNNPPSETHVKETSNNKRKLSVSHNEDLQNSYYKIRVLVRQLRPHFIQVLQTPDFRNCNAAHEIKKNLKLVLDLYKQMIAETDPPVNVVTEPQTLSGENVFEEQDPDKVQEGKEAELLKTEDCAEKSTDIKHPMPCSSSEWKLNDDQFRGSYIVGGSVFGWNFITYGGSKPVYYGLTKESYLNRQMKS